MNHKVVLIIVLIIPIIVGGVIWQVIKPSTATLNDPLPPTQKAEDSTTNSGVSNIKLSFGSKNTSDWNRMNWESFSFLYPLEFVLIDGDAKNNYFYMSHSSTVDSSFLQISGISEKNNGQSLISLAQSRKEQYANVFDKYVLVNSRIDNDMFIHEFTWDGDGTGRIVKSYEFIKIKDGEIKLLRFSYEIELMKGHEDVVTNIVENIK